MLAFLPGKTQFPSTKNANGGKHFLIKNASATDKSLPTFTRASMKQKQFPFLHPHLQFSRIQIYQNEVWTSSNQRAQARLKTKERRG